MSIRAHTAFTVGFAALVCAVPAAAQQRGTVEFGAFGSAATFDNALSLKTGYGGGGRVGMFLDPRWAIEFEDAEMRGSRPNGLRDVNVGILSGRLVAEPIKSGAMSILLGGGAGVSTETNFLHTYGLDALVGAKFKLRENVSLRVDGVWDWLANQDWKSYKSVRLGLSVYRRPARETRTVTVVAQAAPAPAPMMMAHEDSVSAAETRRLRERDAALRALRDSLRSAPVRTEGVTLVSPTRATMATMEAQIHFAFNKSVLTDSAKAILDEKVAVFRANPPLTIVILGYNMALGERRAQAAKSYIVAKGIAENRVIIESRGERHQIPNTVGKQGEAPNRRAIFRLLIAPDEIAKP
jgi:outer membrane protein OmpA-like peptidoglycan-associated protein